MPNRDRQIVVMGVMGAGKTTVGLALAQRLGCRFFDADDLHPHANRQKLATGAPLTETDRAPWVDRVAALIGELHDRGETAVIACSALTEKIRSRLAAAGEVAFVHLQGNQAHIGYRLRGRSGHFADPSLLASQYAALEAPAEAIVADAALPAEVIVDAVMDALGS